MKERLDVLLVKREIWQLPEKRQKPSLCPESYM